MLDRASEIAALEGVLAAVRDGLSGVLVLRGDVGIGKTVLLEWAAGQAHDMQLARVAGIQAEMGMGFAGLHQLLVPFLGGLDGLPGPQQQALGSAFGLVAGPAPDRFLVGLAALTLLTDAAAGQPVLCLVDDAQWLDQVSVEVLGFIARRLYADRVGVLFTVREGEGQAAALAGLPELMLGGLPGEVASELLAVSAAGPVDGRVSAQIVSGVVGNPLALVELAAELTPRPGPPPAGALTASGRFGAGRFCAAGHRWVGRRRTCATAGHERLCPPRHPRGRATPMGLYRYGGGRSPVGRRGLARDGQAGPARPRRRRARPALVPSEPHGRGDRMGW